MQCVMRLVFLESLRVFQFWKKKEHVNIAYPQSFPSTWSYRWFSYFLFLHCSPRKVCLWLISSLIIQVKRRKKGNVWVNQDGGEVCRYFRRNIEQGPLLYMREVNRRERWRLLKVWLFLDYVSHLWVQEHNYPGVM